MRIIVASSNRGKIKEIRNFFEGIEVIAYTDLMEPINIIENGNSFKENAIKKAKEIYKFFKDDIVLADDSGITVPVLGNIPGIYSARFAGENASDKENLNKLIEELKKYNIKKTFAYYTAAIALATPYGMFTTHGFMRGDVIDEARGNKGFGYDPMFIPKGFAKTLGELDEKIKKEISHRSKALSLALIIYRVMQ
jgi:XTP/dITP diphosphohydrolase